ncbi:LolA family protein [Hanstruepera marina]|uniref:LolA family protein n=1 Tax=Hanstruepera marina TaxID=2873265 RepID=UPI001CA6F78A|nr:outer membrane lipoprotein carrier protein LolA [Hanstruepera marina]
MRRLCFILILVSTTVMAQTPLNNSESRMLIKRVKDKALTTKTILSDFTQYKHLDFLTNDIITHGNLSFKAPDLVKWEYTNPYSYSVIFKNETLYINDEGNKSEVNIGSSKLFKQLNNLIIKSVKGDMFDDSEFDISYFKNDNQFIVHFKPRDKKFAKYISDFHISYNQDGDVEEVKMIEASGDYTKIVFSKKVLNKPIDNAVFNN